MTVLAQFGAVSVDIGMVWQPEICKLRKMAVDSAARGRSAVMHLFSILTARLFTILTARRCFRIARA